MVRFVTVDRKTRVLLEPLPAARLERLCRQAFGEEVRISGQQLLDSGHFNTSYRIELRDRAPVVLRIAPPATARLWRHEAAALRRQCAIQGALAALGPVIPRILYVDFSGRELARDFAFFECLEGRLWAEAEGELDARQRAGLWYDYGALVRRLHAVRGNHFGFPAPLPPHARFSDWLIELLRGLGADLREAGLEVAGLSELHAILEVGRARLDAIGEPRLVHGDLWPRNVLIRLVDGTAVISGLLDAERAYWGDPASEWIFGFLAIPAAFWRSYGQRVRESTFDPDALWRQRVYQARGALQLILDGMRFGYDAGFARAQFAECLGELRAPVRRASKFSGVRQ